MSIKLVALDLDGTTLDSAGNLPDINKKALEEAITKGIKIVIATGRSYYSLPKEVTEIKGLKYAITSNGAQIRDLISEEVLFSACIDPVAVKRAAEVIVDNGYDSDIEVFVNGAAYMERKTWEDILRGRITYRRKSYIESTRRPVDDIVKFMLSNEDRIENINICFADLSKKPQIRKTLEVMDEISTVTTSFDNNWEIGGLNTSKANALVKLGKNLGLVKEEMMGCGDSPNDIPMIKACGIGVAMGNAKESVKEIANFISGTNDEGGVSQAIHKFVL